jgi:hypothetical protein
MDPRWIAWYLIASLTGNPLGTLVVLALVWWIGDRFTFRLLPDPLRPLGRWRRMGQLRRTLAANPHDRRARLELGQLLLDARGPREAVEVLRPNVEAGDDDVHTAFAMGTALARSGFREQAERVLALAREADPKFRMGEIDLEIGRMRVAGRDFAGARQPLERLVSVRPGTVEGRWLLARALSGSGDEAGARRVRDEAWREYATLPRFHRRHERPFAWRIRPWRPAAAVILALLLAALAARVAMPVIEAGARARPAGGEASGDE